MNNIESLQDRIIADLQNAGFPSEIKALSLLQKDWFAENGILFLDPDTNKERELDILASQAFKETYPKPGSTTGKMVDVQMQTHLVIEVKLSSKPWVFFNNGRLPANSLPEHLFLTDQPKRWLKFQTLTEVGVTTHRMMNVEMHRSHHVSFSDKNTPSSIYEAQMKIAKATEYLKKETGPTKSTELHMFVPIIILDGTLWSASLVENDLKVKETDHLFCLFNTFVTENDEMIERIGLCEVVTIPYFKEYIDTISSDSRSICRAWSKYLEGRAGQPHL